MKQTPKLYNKVNVTRYENGNPVEYEVVKTVPLMQAEADALNIHKLSGENVRYILAPEKTKTERAEAIPAPENMKPKQSKQVPEKRTKKQSTS